MASLRAMNDYECHTYKFLYGAVLVRLTAASRLSDLAYYLVPKTFATRPTYDFTLETRFIPSHPIQRSLALAIRHCAFCVQNYRHEIWIKCID